MTPAPPIPLEISFREGWDNPARFGPTMWQANGVRVTHPPDIGSDRTILIHGYNNPAARAGELYAKIAAARPGGYINLYWPGESVALRFEDAVENANETGWRLRDLVAGEVCDFITHSLGARVFSQAFNWGENLAAGDAFMVAAAIPHDALENELAGVPYWSKTLNIFCSGNDPVLRDDFPLGSNFKKALGLHGPANLNKLPQSNIRVVDFSRIVHSHSGYFDLPEFYATIADCKSGKLALGYTTL
jgi:hypothetical protein